MPKRPLSAYMFYTKDVRPSLGNMSVTEQAKELGNRWAQMTDAQKEVWSQRRLCLSLRRSSIVLACFVYCRRPGSLCLACTSVSSLNHACSPDSGGIPSSRQPVSTARSSTHQGF